MTVTYIQPAKTPIAKCLAEGSTTAARKSLIAFPMRAPNKPPRTPEPPKNFFSKSIPNIVITARMPLSTMPKISPSNNSLSIKRSLPLKIDHAMLSNYLYSSTELYEEPICLTYR